MLHFSFSSHVVQYFNISQIIREAIVAQWVRSQFLKREVPGSNQLAAATEAKFKQVMTVGQGTLSSLLSSL